LGIGHIIGIVAGILVPALTAIFWLGIRLGSIQTSLKTLQEEKPSLVPEMKLDSIIEKQQASAEKIDDLVERMEMADRKLEGISTHQIPQLGEAFKAHAEATTRLSEVLIRIETKLS